MRSFSLEANTDILQFKKDSDQELQSDWIFASLVIDRLFAIMFCVATILLTMMLLVLITI